MCLLSYGRLGYEINFVDKKVKRGCSFFCWEVNLQFFVVEDEFWYDNNNDNCNKLFDVQFLV